MKKRLKQLFEEYMKETYDFCPYLEKANITELVKTETMIFDTCDTEVLSEELFYLFIEKVELFRLNRSRIEKQKIPFYTVNILFDSSKDPKNKLDWESIISWPHFMVKYLYSSEQIMFGKFWKNEITKSKFQEGNIPIPKLNFLSIRTAVKRRDLLLLSKTKDLALEIEESAITNNSVITVSNQRKEVLCIDELRELDYYHQLKISILKKYEK